jgi:stress response protein YsnF
VKKISERKKKRKTNKTNNDDNSDDNNNNDNSKKLPIKNNKSIQVANIIPVLEERFSISKKPLIENIKIEKKWIAKTKTIEVPVSVEEVYINDKRMRSYEKDDNDDQEEDVLSETNKRIVQSFEDMDDNNQHKQYSILESNESKRELIPLFDDIANNIDNSTEDDVVANKEMKKVIPILGEEIVVSKRIVKIGELIITKNKVTENKKIAIDTRNEKVTIRHPDGRPEKLS